VCRSRPRSRWPRSPPGARRRCRTTCALGNEEGRAERRHTLRIALTPWCEVHIDPTELEALNDEKLEILGTALTQALQEERSRTR
jgi:hypothetical protein